MKSIVSNATSHHARHAVLMLAVSVLGLMPLAAGASPVLTTLYTFSGGADGKEPMGGVVLDKQGRLYGTTFYGGAYSDQFAPGGGTVFQLVPPAHHGTAWTENVLVNYFGPTQGQQCSQPLLGNNGVAGFAPTSEPTFDSSGHLYAAASQSGCDEGTVVELTPGNGGFSIANVLQFDLPGQPPDGNTPLDAGGLIYDASGNVYGTTEGDGAYDLGEVFELGAGLPNNAVTLLLSFPKNESLGDGPTTGLTAGPNGVLYGTTGGGFGHVQTVFQLNSDGSTALLHTFKSSTGIDPGPLVLRKGKIYGTTLNGGTLQGGGAGQGVAYELSNKNGAWSYKVLHTFGEGTDGAHPSQIVFDRTGAIYGNATNGGQDGVSGVLYALSPPSGKHMPWTEKILWYFTQGADGGQPSGELAMDKSGTLYGTTIGAGQAPYGTVFQLVP